MKRIAFIMVMMSATLSQAMGPSPQPGAERDPIWEKEKAGYATVDHAHDASSISTGTLDSARLSPDISRLGNEIEGAEIALGTITLDHLGSSGANVNDVPQWNGASWSPAPSGMSPHSRLYLSISPVAVRPMNQPHDGLGLSWHPAQFYIEFSRPGGTASFFAPLHVPHGASIHSIAYGYVDNDPTRMIKMGIMGTPLTGSGWFEGGLITQTTSTERVRSVRKLDFPIIVNNNSNSYALLVQIDTGASTNLQFTGASIEYTLP
jgi:hypothetical protein